jgi:hypothetical protein
MKSFQNQGTTQDSMRRRDVSILLGLASSFVVSLTYVIRPADPDQSAGGNFAWNLMFDFPAMAAESVLALISLFFFLSFVRQPVNKSWWSLIVSPLLVLPCAYEVWWTTAAVVAISRLTHGVAGK